LNLNNKEDEMEMKLVLVPMHDPLTLSHGFAPYRVPGLFFPRDYVLVSFYGPREDRDISVRIAKDDEHLEECFGLQLMTEMRPAQIHALALNYLSIQEELRKADRLIGPADRKIERELVQSVRWPQPPLGA
jgi:hypothetical protein